MKLNACSIHNERVLQFEPNARIKIFGLAVIDFVTWTVFVLEMGFVMYVGYHTVKQREKFRFS